MPQATPKEIMTFTKIDSAYFVGIVVGTILALTSWEINIPVIILGALAVTFATQGEEP